MLKLRLFKFQVMVNQHDHVIWLRVGSIDLQEKNCNQHQYQQRRRPSWHTDFNQQQQRCTATKTATTVTPIHPKPPRRVEAAVAAPVAPEGSRRAGG